MSDKDMQEEIMQVFGVYNVDHETGEIVGGPIQNLLFQTDTEARVFANEEGLDDYVIKEHTLANTLVNMTKYYTIHEVDHETGEIDKTWFDGKVFNDEKTTMDYANEHLDDYVIKEHTLVNMTNTTVI